MKNIRLKVPLDFNVLSQLATNFISGANLLDYCPKIQIACNLFAKHGKFVFNKMVSLVLNC